jgi:hypothetical protein
VSSFTFLNSPFIQTSKLRTQEKRQHMNEGKVSLFRQAFADSGLVPVSSDVDGANAATPPPPPAASARAAARVEAGLPLPPPQWSLLEVYSRTAGALDSEDGVHLSNTTFDAAAQMYLSGQLALAGRSSAAVEAMASEEEGGENEASEEEGGGNEARGEEQGKQGAGAAAAGGGGAARSGTTGKAADGGGRAAKPNFVGNPMFGLFTLFIFSGIVISRDNFPPIAGAVTLVFGLQTTSWSEVFLVPAFRGARERLGISAHSDRSD